jgi:hypothetical protein
MKVTVKDIVDHLNTLPPDAQVELDKDGWMEDELPHEGDVQKLIQQRGVFYRGDNYLVINN